MANDSGVVRKGSWSRYSRYTGCPKSYELAYLRRAPRRPGVWLPAGTAFHATIEHYLRESLEAQHA